MAIRARSVGFTQIADRDERQSRQPWMPWLLGVLAAALIGVGVTAASNQVIFMTCVLLALSLCSVRVVFVTGVLSIFFLAFFRRILASEAGRVENDILVLLPAILTIIVLFWAVNRNRQIHLTGILLPLAFAGICAISFILNFSFSITVIYSTLIMCLSWCLYAAVRAGYVPDIWPFLYRSLPAVGFAVSCYGLFQFFYLPSWDARWMVASKLTSIGLPLPLEVRVFSTTESPGPFALVVGVCVLISFVSAFSNTGLKRYIYIAFGMTGFVAIALSGVRTALLGIAIVLLLLSAFWLRGFVRLVPVAIGAFGYFALERLIGLYGASSTILSSDRLTNLDASRDDSIQARLSLFTSVPANLRRPLGGGVAVDPNTGEPSSLDSTFLDVLLRYGPVALLILAIIFCLVIRSVIRTRATDGESRIALACVSLFLITFSWAGNIFVSGLGILAAVVFASLVREDTTNEHPEVKPLERAPQLLPVRRHNTAAGHSRPAHAPRS